jgi:hypothetical protein
MRGQQQGRLPGVPEEKPFVEAEIAPPPYPSDSTLIEFTPTGQTSNRFYIDGSSLTVDPDKIVRFVLLIRTPGAVERESPAGGWPGIRPDLESRSAVTGFPPDR